MRLSVGLALGGVALLHARAPGALAHICLLNPVQRGGYNVSDPGDWSCFQPKGPCGTVPSAAPAITLSGGQGFNIVFQQNLNHYNPGWPGFLDVAYAPFPDPPSDDNFTVLATVPDFWAHLQASQTNFSVPVVVPNVDCSHCIIRVRYHPNKPTEPIFHNCADVAIQSTATPALAPAVFITATNNFGPPTASIGGALMRAQPSGALDPEIDFMMAARVTPIEGMSTVVGGIIYSIARSIDGDITDLSANRLIAYDPSLRRATSLNISLPANDPNPPQQWTAIASAPQWLGGANGGQPLVVLGLVPAGQYTYSYQARLLNPSTGQVGPVLAASVPTDTFVNFFWATNVYPTNGGKSGVFYFLGGDENNLVQLDALIYTAVLTPGSGSISNITAVPQDISSFTLSSLTVDPATGSVYAVSPGLFGATAFSLVQVNPATGAVSQVGQITQSGVFDSWYGGNVYGDAITNGTLAHVFRRSFDHSYVLATIDVATGSMPLSAAPTLLTGVNNMLSINTPVRVAVH